MPTTWTERSEVSTAWSERTKPLIYISPLEDAYTEVYDEEDELIYIICNDGKAVALTNWTARTPI